MADDDELLAKQGSISCKCRILIKPLVPVDVVKERSKISIDSPELTKTISFIAPSSPYTLQLLRVP